MELSSCLPPLPHHVDEDALTLHSEIFSSFITMVLNPQGLWYSPPPPHHPQKREERKEGKAYQLSMLRFHYLESSVCASPHTKILAEDIKCKQ